MADGVTWYPEGGYYEKQAGQGEDQWADNAEFDTISCPAVDTQNTASDVSWGDLAAEASYNVQAYSKLYPNQG